MHSEMLGQYPDLKPIYDKILEYNSRYPAETEEEVVCMPSDDLPVSEGERALH